MRKNAYLPKDYRGFVRNIADAASALIYSGRRSP